MSRLDLPPEISSVLREYYTCEMTTVNRQKQPITWPCLPYYDEASGQILLSVSIAFPIKAFNARQHPQVSLLYSDPTGSKLDRAPALLIQGDATVKELLDYSSPAMRSAFRALLKRQPDSRRMLSNRIMRSLFGWYIFQRLLITIRPRRLLIWQEGDFSVAPIEREISYVE